MNFQRRIRSRLAALAPADKSRLYQLGERLGLPRARRLLQPALWGSLRRRSPFPSGRIRRGTPVFTHYSDRFFDRHCDDIVGEVLEAGSAGLSRRSSGAVSSVEVIGTVVDDDEITIYGELDACGLLPEARFDTAVIPGALGSTRDLGQAIANVMSSLSPGGVLLATVPVVGPVSGDGTGGERWHVPPAALERIARDACPGADVSVEALGCLPGQVAATVGLAAEELRDTELWSDDRRHPVVSGLRVVRP
ncbi:MAG: hypothetical protein JJLCMIEE_00842 [Acidimicrobiales bacterium]|nr:hypothetical protein [Acidimicrobiales bacterium]